MRMSISHALTIITSGILLIGISIYLYSQIVQPGKQVQVKTSEVPPQKDTRIGDSQNTPEIPGSRLKYKIIGASSVSLLFELKFEESYYDYDYTIDIGDAREGFLFLAPPPEGENVQVYVTAISETGKRSEPLVFTNKQWWRSVSESKKEYAMEHTFRF